MSLGKHPTYRIPNVEEIRRRTTRKKNIPFRILILGESGLGKKTFCNNICGQQLFVGEQSQTEGKNHNLESDVEMVVKHFDLVEIDSTPISLDFVVLANFGDAIDNSSSCKIVSKYLEAQFDRILSEEIRIKRNVHMIDTRPHVCLYFIRATSRGLSEFDISTMKALCDKVNLIPVIGKADTLTERELELNKKLIINDIQKNHIKLYDFGEQRVEDILIVPDSKEPSQSGKLNSSQDPRDIYPTDPGYLMGNATGLIKELLPFSIIGSNNTQVDDNGKPVHFRSYPWGTVTIENANHSNFIHLKNILLGSHLQELKDSTHEILYENYRMKKLQSTNFGTDDIDRSILAESTILQNGVSCSFSLSDALLNSSQHME